jgi:hypothetical protein
MEDNALELNRRNLDRSDDKPYGCAPGQHAYTLFEGLFGIIVASLHGIDHAHGNPIATDKSVHILRIGHQCTRRHHQADAEPTIPVFDPEPFSSPRTLSRARVQAAGSEDRSLSAIVVQDGQFTFAEHERPGRRPAGGSSPSYRSPASAALCQQTHRQCARF